MLRVGLVYKITNRGLLGIGYQWLPIFTNRLPINHNGFNKIFTNHEWYKLVKTNILFCNGKTWTKHWQ